MTDSSDPVSALLWMIFSLRLLNRSCDIGILLRFSMISSMGTGVDMFVDDRSAFLLDDFACCTLDQGSFSENRQSEVAR